MRGLVLLGFDHRSAPIAVRERMAFAEEGLGAALARLRERSSIAEAMILSTCNRVEVLVRAEGDAAKAAQAIREFLTTEHGVTAEEIGRHGYRFEGREAIRHLFQVATGLESMILGEPQILGQVKQAYHAAKVAGATGPVLERLLQQCLASAKRARTATGVSRHAVSVAFAAVELARQIFGRLAGRRTLVLGAGKMSELVARHLRASGVAKIEVASRTYDRSVASAERCGGQAIHWQDGLGRLDQVDIVVSCTGAPGTILHKADIASALRARRGQRLLLIDIAMPRDVDPAVNELDNVYLYDIDALQDVVDANLGERRRAARQAERLIEDDVRAFELWLRSREVTPTIVALRQRMIDLGRQQLERSRNRLGSLTLEQERGLEELTRALVLKILHRPTVYLRKTAGKPDGADGAAVCREMFGLDEDPVELGSGDQRREAPRDEPDAQGPSRLIHGGKE